MVEKKIVPFLSEDEYNWVQNIVMKTKSANELRRGLSLLWYADGQPVSSIARQLRVSTTVVYKWIRVFIEVQGEMTDLNKVLVEGRLVMANINKLLAERRRGRPRKDKKTPGKGVT